MGNRLYVGNMPQSLTSADLEGLFSPFGEVRSASVVTDRHTGHSRGFGFVEMGNSAAARAAMEEINGQRVDGRFLVVNEANDTRSSRSGHGRRR